MLKKELLLNERQEGFSYFLLKHLTKDTLWLALKYDIHWFKNRLFE